MGRKKAPRRNVADEAPSPREAKEILKKRPKKRKGPGNPGKKATQKEVEERIVGVAQMLARRLQVRQIKAFLFTQFDLGGRMAEEYISRGREYLIEQSNRPSEQFVSEAVGFYEEVIRNPESSISDRMNAQAALRQMLGLDKPFKLAGTTPDGEDSAPLIAEKAVAALTDQQLAGLHALHWAMQAAREGKPLMQPAPLALPIATNHHHQNASGTSLSVGNEKTPSLDALATSDATSFDDPLTIDVPSRESPST